MARSWVGLTILACLPCIVAPRSAGCPCSYANSFFIQECYECVVMSSKNPCQTRFPPALRHKGCFPYEYLLTPGRGCPAGCRVSTLRPSRCPWPTRGGVGQVGSAALKYSGRRVPDQCRRCPGPVAVAEVAGVTVLSEAGSCWIPGSWIYQWRTTRLLSCSLS